MDPIQRNKIFNCLDEFFGQRLEQVQAQDLVIGIKLAASTVSLEELNNLAELFTTDDVRIVYSDNLFGDGVVELEAAFYINIHGWSFEEAEE